MKPVIQLFPQVLDSYKVLKNHYATLPNLEEKDINLLNFIQRVEQHFDFKNLVNFRLPKNLEKISEMFSGMTNEEIIKNFLPNALLPFTTISIELEYDFHALTEGFEMEDLVIIAQNHHENGKSYIDIMFNHGVVMKGANGKKKGKLFKPTETIIRFSTNPEICDEEWFQILGDTFDENMEFITSHAFSIVLFLMASLSCHNVEISKDFPPSILENNKRVKKGLTTYKQLHYITIKPTTTKGVPNKNKGSYTPKVTHVRRGHIRRYENKSIWVEQTIVNGGGGQAVPKAYVLK